MSIRRRGAVIPAPATLPGRVIDPKRGPVYKNKSDEQRRVRQAHSSNGAFARTSKAFVERGLRGTRPEWWRRQARLPCAYHKRLAPHSEHFYASRCCHCLIEPTKLIHPIPATILTPTSAHQRSNSRIPHSHPRTSTPPPANTQTPASSTFPTSPHPRPGPVQTSPPVPRD